MLFLYYNMPLVPTPNCKLCAILGFVMSPQSFENQKKAHTWPLMLDGRILRDEGIVRLKKIIAASGKKPTLAIIQVGELQESKAYIERKKNFAKSIGAAVRHIKLPVAVTEDELLEIIRELNTDSAVDGIIVQLPIPKNLNRDKIIDAIDLAKDVDGLTSENKKLFESGDPRAVVPAAAKGVLSLLRFYKIPVAGKKVTVIGRSQLVGAPIATLLRREAAYVTVCHRQMTNTAELSRAADILVAAAGSPKLVTKDYVSKGQTVIDVGINSIEGVKFEEEIPKRRLVGDVDFQSVKDIVGAISPVPGGVGPMTVLSLFENLLDACEQLQNP